MPFYPRPGPDWRPGSCSEVSSPSSCWPRLVADLVITARSTIPIMTMGTSKIRATMAMDKTSSSLRGHRGRRVYSPDGPILAYESDLCTHSGCRFIDPFCRRTPMPETCSLKPRFAKANCFQWLCVWTSVPPSSPRSTIPAKFCRSSSRFRSGLERMFATVSPIAPPGGSE